MKAGLGIRSSGEDAIPRGITVPSVLVPFPDAPVQVARQGRSGTRDLLPACAQFS